MRVANSSQLNETGEFVMNRRIHLAILAALLAVPFVLAGCGGGGGGGGSGGSGTVPVANVGADINASKAFSLILEDPAAATRTATH